MNSICFDKFKPLQVFEVRTNCIGHQPAPGSNKICSQTWRLALDVPIRVCKLVIIQVEEQASVIVVHRRHAQNFLVRIPYIHAEIPKVPVCIEDDCIQNAHAAEFILAADGSKPRQKLCNRSFVPYHICGLYEPDRFCCKQFAF